MTFYLSVQEFEKKIWPRGLGGGFLNLIEFEVKMSHFEVCSL